MSHRAWHISWRTIGIISPLGLAGAALVAIISPDSPIPVTIVVALFIGALCYVLGRITDDLKAHQDAAADEARQHREDLAKQLHGAILREALSWIGAHGHQVDRWEAAAQVLTNTYGPVSDPAAHGDGPTHLRAVRDHERGSRISPSA